MKSATVNIRADDFYAENLTFANDFNATHPQLPQGSQALALLVTGDMTIRDVTKPVVLHVEYGGVSTDPYGNLKAAFSAEGEIDRTDFGASWNVALETGGWLVSKEIKLEIDSLAIRAKE